MERLEPQAVEAAAEDLLVRGEQRAAAARQTQTNGWQRLFGNGQLFRGPATLAGDIVVFGSSSLVFFALGVVQTFLIPQVLGIEGFAYWRTFVLYSGFVGVLHFGLLDGLLLRWAGKVVETFGGELAQARRVLLAQQVVLATILLAIAVAAFRGTAWLWVGVGVVAYAIVWNVSTLAQFALQAARRFGVMSVFNVALPSLFLLAFAIAMWAGQASAPLTIALFLAANVACGAWLWLKLGGSAPADMAKQGWLEFARPHVRAGWPLLAVNLLTLFLVVADRIFVNLQLSLNDFAIYSFAGAILAVPQSLIMAVARVVFPHVAGETNDEVRGKIYERGSYWLLVLWGLSLALYFPARAVVEILLPEFKASMPLAAILLVSIFAISAIQVLHASYFRVFLMQNRFLATTGAAVALAAVLVPLGAWLGGMTGIAVAVNVVMLAWWLLNEAALLGRRGGNLQQVFLLAVLWIAFAAGFLFAASAGRTFVAMAGYLIWAVTLTAGICWPRMGGNSATRANGLCFPVSMMDLKATAKRIFPDFETRLLLRRITYAPIDAYESLLGKRGKLVPPRGLRFVGGGDYKAVGIEFFGYFTRLAGLKPEHNVLDIGSGSGRLAIPLTPFLRGKYLGFDPVRPQVEWCRKRISADFPNFKFQVSDVYSNHYNPRGQFTPESYRFPAAERSFDFAFATSVFTHMLPPGISNYLRETSRVLKPGGTFFFTAFLLNAQSGQARNPAIRFQFDCGSYRVVDQNFPEAAVGIDEEWLLDEASRSGFRLKSDILHGSWSGRTEFTSFQDILILERLYDRPGDTTGYLTVES